MCLASRPHPVVALALGDRPGVLMQAHNANAIKQYAFNTMESLGVAANNRTLLERFSGRYSCEGRRRVFMGSICCHGGRQRPRGRGE